MFLLANGPSSDAAIGPMAPPSDRSGPADANDLTLGCNNRQARGYLYNSCGSPSDQEPTQHSTVRADGEKLAKEGHEFGATTGRPRRCGWFDAVVARYAVMINGITWWTITKLDVLDHFDTIKICVAYEVDGQRLDVLPSRIDVLAKCKPVYEEVPGWKTRTSGISRYEDLPAAAQSYIDKLEAITGTPVGIVSVGPRRSETLMRHESAAVLAAS